MVKVWLLDQKKKTNLTTVKETVKLKKKKESNLGTLGPGDEGFPDALIYKT